MDMFIIFLSFILLTLLGIIISVLCHVFCDPFLMDTALKDVKYQCIKSETCLDRLKEILAKMDTCPEVSEYITPIHIADFGKTLRCFIVGNELGIPHLFAYDYSDDLLGDFTDYENRVSSSSFRKHGLRHSITASELRLMINKISAIRFKNDLDKEQERRLKKHFNIL